MNQIVYKNIYKVLIVIGAPDLQGDIVVTNVSGNPKDGLPEIGSDLGVVISEFLDKGYTIESAMMLEGSGSKSQYTLVRTYCIKYNS